MKARMSCMFGWSGVVLCSLLWLGWSGTVWAQDDANCGKLFQAKKYLAAAKCFQKKASAMPPAVQLSRIQRYLKGQTMRNASLAYQRAADQEQNVEIAAYRREQAVQILRQYLKEDLCQKRYLCQQARGVILELLNKINYTPLSIITTPGQRATVKVTGYQYQVQHISPPQWNKAVRPGRFQIEVQYEDGKVIRKQVIVSPGQARTVTLLNAPLDRRPPTPGKQASASPVPWIILGVGLAVGGTGAALLGFGASKTGERDSISSALAQEAANKSPAERLTMAAAADTQQRIQNMDSAHQTAATMFPIGWTLAGVGAATAITGVVLFFVLRPKAAPQTAALPLPNQTHQTTRILTAQ